GAGTWSRHRRSGRVRSSFNATVNAPVSLSTSSAKYGSQSLSSDGEFVSVPLGTRRKRIRSASKSQMLWVDSIRSIRATARGGKERVLRIAGSCLSQQLSLPCPTSDKTEHSVRSRSRRPCPPPAQDPARARL